MACLLEVEALNCAFSDLPSLQDEVQGRGKQLTEVIFD